MFLARDTVAPLLETLNRGRKATMPHCTITEHSQALSIKEIDLPHRK